MLKNRTSITEMTQRAHINEMSGACRGQGCWVLKQESMVSKDSGLPGQLPPADLLRARTGLWMFCSCSFNENSTSKYQHRKSQSSCYTDTETAFKSPAQSMEIPPTQEEGNGQFPQVLTGTALS